MSKPLSAQIAESLLPIQIVGGTGSGKTTLLIRAAEAALAQGTTVYMFDGKPAIAKWKHILEHPLMNYFPVNNPDAIPGIIDTLEKLCETLADVERNEQSPRIMAMVDEFNNQLLYAEIKSNLERLENNGKRGSDHPLALKTWMKLLLSQGRERNCIAVSTTHDASVEATGMSTGMRNNNRFAILGSPDSRENIEDVIQPQPIGVVLVKSESARKALRLGYRRIPRDLFIALTNIGSQSQFRFVKWS